jgi:hypothetical protein
MPRAQLILLGRLPLPDKIAQRLGVFIGNPHRGQISGTVTARQLQRIPPVRLHPVSGFFGTRLGATTAHSTPNCGQLPVKYEACRTGFIAGAQMLGWTKLLDQLADRLFAVGYRSQAANLAIRLGYGYGYRFGMDIQAQKS